MTNNTSSTKQQNPPPSKASPRRRPNPLELLEYGTTNTTIVPKPGSPARLRFFEKIARNSGGRFQTEIGSFELNFRADQECIILTLTKPNEPTKLTARLVTDPQHLQGVRTALNLQRAKRWPSEKVNRTSAKVPCLIVNLQNAPTSFTVNEREILFSIFADAAFGLMKFFRKRNRRRKSAGKRPLFTAGSAQ
jgi:hypothetical protein